MSRPVKGEHEQLACWIPAATMRKLDGYVRRSQLSKREILAAALDMFFERLELLEKKPESKEIVS